MKLFDDVHDRTRNWLPADGIVNYYGKILSPEAASSYKERLMENIQWQNDKTIIYGKEIITKRLVAWYGDKPFTYTYSRTTKYALSWTGELLELKALIEHESGETLFMFVESLS